MLPPKRPTSPESTHSETARVRSSTRWGFRVCACAPSHRHSGNVGHPNTGVTLGRACGATWRAQGSTNGIPSFPPGVATETNTARPRHATNFPPVSTGRYWGVGRVGRCNVHMLRVDRACPFGHREVGVCGGRRCDQPHIPISSPKGADREVRALPQISPHLMYGMCAWKSCHL